MPVNFLFFSHKFRLNVRDRAFFHVSLKKNGKSAVNRIMRIFKYLIGIWAAIAVYTLFSFLAGPKGLSAYNFLLTEKENQIENLKDLGILYEELNRTKNNLIYDHDTLLVHARQMGYGYEDERYIRIVGLSNIKPIPAEVGKVYSVIKPEFIADRHIKIAAFIIGLLLFGFLFTMEVINNRARD